MLASKRPGRYRSAASTVSCGGCWPSSELFASLDSFSPGAAPPRTSNNSAAAAAAGLLFPPPSSEPIEERENHRGRRLLRFRPANSDDADDAGAANATSSAAAGTSPAASRRRTLEAIVPAGTSARRRCIIANRINQSINNMYAEEEQQHHLSAKRYISICCVRFNANLNEVEVMGGPAPWLAVACCLLSLARLLVVVARSFDARRGRQKRHGLVSRGSCIFVCPSSAGNNIQ